MNVLFLGNHPPQDLIDKYSGRFDSFYRSNEALIEGFRKHNEVNIRVITSPDIPSYPKEDFYFKSLFSSRDDTLMASALNVPIIKHFWTAFSMFFEARKVIRKNKGCTYVIIPYMVFRHVLALRLISLFCKNVKVGMVIPDVFFHDKLISRWLNAFTEKMAVKSDFFILYTEAMAEYLGIKNKPFITIEGFKKIPPLYVPEEENNNIVYAGTIDLKYGIERLVKMMSFIQEPDINLHIYGSGDAVDIIKDSSSRDNRIHFHGSVPKSEADKAIKIAMALVNPRNSQDGEFVRFSFPSKDIDYLSSGIPSVLCKLPGMPKEYYGFFIDAGDASPEQLADAVRTIYKMTLEERNAFSLRAYEFIKKRMDLNIQINKIIDLLKVA